MPRRHRCAAPPGPSWCPARIAASMVTVTGLVILTPLVIAGWIAAPHSGLGLPGVVRTATSLWLAAHHVEFTLSRGGPDRHAPARPGPAPRCAALAGRALGGPHRRADQAQRPWLRGARARRTLRRAVRGARAGQPLPAGRAVPARGGHRRVPARALRGRPRRRACAGTVAPAVPAHAAPVPFRGPGHRRGARRAVRGRGAAGGWLAGRAPGGVPGDGRLARARARRRGAARPRAARLRAQRRRLGDLLLARPGIRVRDLDRGGPDRGGAGTAPAVPDARRAAHRHHRGPRLGLGRSARPALRGRDRGRHPGGPCRAHARRSRWSRCGDSPAGWRPGA